VQGAQKLPYRFLLGVHLALGQAHNVDILLSKRYYLHENELLFLVY
jgi:hypothetical protein